MSDAARVATVLDQISISSIIAKWEAESLQTKVGQIESGINLVVGIVGIFVMPVAAAQNDIRVVEMIINVIIEIINLYSTHKITLPHPVWEFKFTPETEVHYRARMLDQSSIVGRIG